MSWSDSGHFGARPTPKLKLIPTSNPQNPAVAFQLPVVIGRGRSADLVVKNPWASRRHCEIDEQNGVLVIQDLGSRNGTFVNQQPIKQARLMPGDTILVGSEEFTAALKEGKSC